MIRTSHDDPLPDLTPPRTWPAENDDPAANFQAIADWAMRRASSTTKRWLVPAIGLVRADQATPIARNEGDPA